MTNDRTRIQELVDLPSESLSVEYKRWIDPKSPDGKVKIIKAIIAIRNFGGGYLVIGFDNKTMQPDKNNIPTDVRSAFHTDKIQGLVGKYSSEVFEVAVEFPERDGQAYPVIVIPSGVKTPVLAKTILKNSGGKILINIDDLFIRTLETNNTPSTAKAGWKDLPKIMEICFNNREADISGFIRRHFMSQSQENIKALITLFAEEKNPPEVTVNEFLTSFLNRNELRYEAVSQERMDEIPQHGTWEIALKIIGDVPEHKPNRKFLNLLSSANPDYTGWPIWLDSRNFREERERPYIFDDAWEAFILDLGQKMYGGHLDFMRLDPKGEFYLRRALQDDVVEHRKGPKPLTELDYGLVILRVAETMAVGLAFAKAMGCDEPGTNLAFAFRWKGLKGRMLTSWANPEKHLYGGGKTVQDEITTFVNIPLETPLSALSDYVAQAVKPLFILFQGFEIDLEFIEDRINRLINRKL